MSTMSFRPALDALMVRQSLSEDAAAILFGVPIYTFRKWRDGSRSPTSSALRLLEVFCTLEAMAPTILASLIPAPESVPVRRTRAPKGAAMPAPE